MTKGSDQPRRRRGRPALPAEEGKRFNLGIRTTRELRDSLEAAADSSGLSVAREIERRLRLTIELDRAVPLSLLLELATAYSAGQESGVINRLLRRGAPNEDERSLRWHAMASALLTYRANNPIKELKL